jgi:transposase-like protein
VSRIAKITSADYPNLLAAADEGVSQRALARRYGCAPSLIARHLARARRELTEALEAEVGPDLRVTPVEGSVQEIVEARIRDPKTPARDLASLVNAVAQLGTQVGYAAPGEPTFLSTSAR